MPWREPILLAGGCIHLYAGAQLIPLPGGILELISPEAAAIRFDSMSISDPARAELGTGGELSLSHPVSLSPWATRQSAYKLCAYLLVALICIDLAAVQKWRMLLVRSLVLSGCAQALYGLGEYVSGRQQIFGYVKKHYTEAATGTFINRNHFAGYLELVIPMAIALAVIMLGTSRQPQPASVLRRMAALSGKDLFAATLVMLGALFMVSALVSSHSRMGMASAALSLLCAGAYQAWQGKGKGFATAALVLTGMAVILFSQAGALSKCSAVPSI